MVAQEAFVQSERRKRVAAKATSTQLSFPEEQGGGVRGQQGGQGYVPLVAKKARVAQAKHLARAREKLQSSKSKPPPNVLQASSRFGQPKKVASKAAGGPCEPPKPRPKPQKKEKTNPKCYISSIFGGNRTSCSNKEEREEGIAKGRCCGRGR